MTARPSFVSIFLLLAGLAILGPLVIDAMLPALPAMAVHFGVEPGAMQTTIGALTLGTALGQLLYGPLADKFGRKPVLLGGLIVFTATSLGAIFMPSVEALSALRFFQGLAIAAAMIVSRAIVRDLFDGDEAAKLFAYLLFVLGLMPIAGPVIGGQLAVRLGWESVFWLMAVIGAALLAAIWIFLSETLQRRDPGALNIKAIGGNFRRIIADRAFLGYTLCTVGAYGGLFAILAAVAPVLINFLGEAPDIFGIEFAIIMSGHLVAAGLGGRAVGRFGINRLVIAGIVLSAVSGLAMLGLALAGVVTREAIIVPAFFFMIGFALSVPAATAGALSPFAGMAGRTSSLLGFFQQGAGSAVAIATGILADGTQMPMAWAIAGSGMVSLAALWAVPGMVKRHGKQ